MRKLIICGTIVSTIGIAIGVLCSCGPFSKGKNDARPLEFGEVTTEALGAFKKAESLLNGQDEFFVLAKGAVDAKKAGINLTSQTIYAVSEKVGDQFLIESNSYSGIVKCATRAYSTDKGVRVYKGSNVSKDGSTATWDSSTYTDYSNDDYELSWGRQVSNPFTYEITEDSVINQELLDSSDDIYKYRITLDNEKGVTGYRRQMKTISNLPEEPKFSTVQFTFTVNKEGYILSSNCYEVYKTKYAGFTADCIGSLDSIYYYGDVKSIPTLNENTSYNGVSQVTSNHTPTFDNPIEKIYTPAEKIIKGFTNNVYSAFDGKLAFKNPNGKEIALIGLSVFLDLDDLDNVKVQGNINSNTHGYYLDANFSFNLGEKVLYINSSRVNVKFDINDASDAANKVIGFVNQFLEKKISLQMPEIDLEVLLDTINKSVEERQISNGNLQWTINLLEGTPILVEGDKDTFDIKKVSIPKFNINDYSLSATIKVASLQASPIVDLDIDKDKTQDLAASLQVLDFIQSFIDEKRFALSATASKTDSEGNETYSFEAQGQFDLDNLKIQANFDFTDINGTHNIVTGYQNEEAYIAYQERLKGKLSKASIIDLYTYVITLLDDEEFMNKVGSMIKLDSSNNIVELVKNGQLDTIKDKAIDFELNNEVLRVNLDLSLFNLDGNVEFSMNPNGTNLNYLNVVINDNGEQLVISFIMDEVKDFVEIDLSDYIDFSSISRLVKILKETVFDQKYFALNGTLDVNIPVLGSLKIGLKAEIRALDTFGDADGKLTMDVGIMSFITDDKMSSSNPYPSISGYYVSGIKNRTTTIYIHNRNIIIKRVDKLTYRKIISEKNITNTVVKIYSFEEFADNYMDVIYFALGVSDTAQGIINDAISSNSSSDNTEKNDYSQIIKSFEYSQREDGLGGQYNIDCDLGAMLHSSSLSTLQIALRDDNKQLTGLYIYTDLASVVKVSGDFELESFDDKVPFDEFDSYVNTATEEKYYVAE